MSKIATVRGELKLEISGTPAVSLGWVDIPIEVVTQPEGVADLDAHGSIVLKCTPNMREVRELITQVFAADARAD